MQLAPIFCFVALDTGWLAGGNFYGVQPFEGRYDAMNPSVFGFNKRLVFEGSLPGIGGECRDAKWIRVGGGKKLLVLARNNEGLAFFRSGYFD
jgi:enediyne biosynthesis protein E4